MQPNDETSASGTAEREFSIYISSPGRQTGATTLAVVIADSLSQRGFHPTMVSAEDPMPAISRVLAQDGEYGFNADPNVRTNVKIYDHPVGLSVQGTSNPGGDVHHVAFPASANGTQAYRAVGVFGKVLERNSDYAWSWHCNLTMAAVDRGVPHKQASEASAAFLSLVSNGSVDITQNPFYQQSIDNWAQREAAAPTDGKTDKLNHFGLTAKATSANPEERRQAIDRLKAARDSITHPNSGSETRAVREEDLVPLKPRVSETAIETEAADQLHRDLSDVEPAMQIHAPESGDGHEPTSEQQAAFNEAMDVTAKSKTVTWTPEDESAISADPVQIAQDFADGRYDAALLGKSAPQPTFNPIGDAVGARLDAADLAEYDSKPSVIEALDRQGADKDPDGVAVAPPADEPSDGDKTE